LAPGLRRRVELAGADVQRSATLCEAGRLPRARAALRAAERRLLSAPARLRSRGGREVIAEDVARQLARLVTPSAADVKALRGGLVCPCRRASGAGAGARILGSVQESTICRMPGRRPRSRLRTGTAVQDYRHRTASTASWCCCR